MNSDILDVADCSVIYLSFDEPQKEEFWLRIKDMCPWATRIDGVKGSDAAHKAAGAASETERFFLIDGDNLPNEEFFNLQLDFTNKDENYKLAQYRWRAINAINGLRYGNGGISSWTKTYVANMKTHENSEGMDATTVDFCMDGSDSLYWPMYDCYSTTYPNKTPFQAWRAGFREGVKMVLDKGSKPNITDFKERVASRNLNNLTIWHNVGLDVENGDWAIYGSRLGTYYTMLCDWEYKKVMWFDNLSEIWEDVKNNDPIENAKNIGEHMVQKLGLPMCILDKEQSKFFKRHYNADKHNMGPLTKEMDVIRKLEGW